MLMLNLISPFLAKTSNYPTFSWDYNDLDGLAIRLAINLLCSLLVGRLVFVRLCLSVSPLVVGALGTLLIRIRVLVRTRGMRGGRV